MTKRVVGYFENWAQYRQAGGKFFPAQINPGFFTHINFAFGLIGFVTWSVDPSPTRTGSQRYTGDYTVQPVEWNDQTVLYPAIQALKQQNKSLKTLLSIGGWSMNSCDDMPNSGNPHPYGPFTCQLFSKMAADSQGRSQFINSAIAYARKYGFDGIDIDWEYPGYIGRGGGPNDLANFLALAQEFRAAAGSGFLLTMAAPAIVPTGLPQNYHDNPASYFQWLQQCSQSFDWLNVMSYDYHGAFDDPIKIGTGVNSPLLQDSTPSGPFSIKNTVDTYLAAGISADKMVLGMPTYGRGYTVSNPGGLASNTSYGQPFSSPSPAGPATQVPGVLAYYEVAQQIASGSLTQKWDAATLTPYAYNSTSGEWVSYDNPDSVAYKTAYVNAMKLGGAMIWSIDDDDFASGYPLVTKIKDILDHPEHGPQLPGTSTSQVDFPTDLLGIFTSDLSPEPFIRAKSLDATRSERGSHEALTSFLAELSGAPGVVDYNGVLWLFFEQAKENGVLSCKTYDLTTKALADVTIGAKNNGTTGAPAVAVYNDKIWCVHEGAGKSGKLYNFTYDGATDEWTDDQEIPLGAVNAGSDRHNYPSVALAAYGTALYAVYEGGDHRGGGQLWYNTTVDVVVDPHVGGWGAAKRVEDSNGNGFGTSNGPGLAVIANKLSCWHEGAYQDGQLWVTNFDGSQWSPDHKVNVSTSGPPGVAAIPVDEYNNKKLYVIHEGPKQSGVLWSFNNNTFEDQPLAKGKAVSYGSPRLVWDYADVVAAVGEQRTASGTGSGITYAYSIGTQRSKPKLGFNLLIPLDGRESSPYPGLPNYSLDLRTPNPYYVADRFPVAMARHHIIPHNRIVAFWNKMINEKHIGAGGRSFATLLLAAMNDMLGLYEVRDTVNKTVLSLLLFGIEYGHIIHDPNVDITVRPPGWDDFRLVYEWLPGDLFVGPGKGTDPRTGKQGKEWRSDDPGDNFEKNAQVVVGGALKTLTTADTAIQDYVAGRTATPNKASLNLGKIVRARFNPYGLDPANWSLNSRTLQFALVIQSQLGLQSRPQESVTAE